MRWSVRLVVLTVAVTLCLGAADKKAFNGTGTWKLNVDKSDFGPMPPTKSQVMTIKESEGKIIVDNNVEGEMGQMEMHMVLEKGKESVNEVMGMEFHTTLTEVAEGQQEETWAELPNGGGKFEIKSISKISDDGKVLTQDVNMKSPMGEGTQKLIFDKQ